MEARIALITLLTDDAPRLATFYRKVLGFEVADDMGQYVELANEGVRFAICERAVMSEATGHKAYEAASSGQAFELAFPCHSPQAVDAAYERIVANGATPIKEPATMPWGQRTAFFADPEGNIHELFADLPAEDLE